MSKFVNPLIVRSAVLFAACWLAAGAADAAEPAGASDAPVALRAEVQALRPICYVDGPVWVRFTLTNPSDAAVELPSQVAADPTDGVGLPLDLVFGTTDQPALSFSLDGDPPAIIPPPSDKPAASPHTIRLLPHGSLGVDVDLRAILAAFRYAGSFVLEWRPLDGRLGTTTASFRVEMRKDVILVTDSGRITFVLDYDNVAHNLESFLDLVRQNFYNGKTFHRVVPGFLLQGGDAKGDGTGVRPDGRLVPAEFNSTPFELGTLAMARKPSDPNSASCQFFIALDRLPDLDGKYTVLGQARDEESIRTLRALAAVPTDRRNRPIAPLIIRSINLVDAESTRTVDLSPAQFRTSTTTAPTTPAAPANPAPQQP